MLFDCVVPVRSPETDPYVEHLFKRASSRHSWATAYERWPRYYPSSLSPTLFSTSFNIKLRSGGISTLLSTYLGRTLDQSPRVSQPQILWNGAADSVLAHRHTVTHAPQDVKDNIISHLAEMFPWVVHFSLPITRNGLSYCSFLTFNISKSSLHMRYANLNLFRVLANNVLQA